jgi:ribosomal protein S18 acetylase RimI-like enzyme
MPLAKPLDEPMNLRLRAAKSEDRAFLHELNRLAYEDVVTRQFGVWDDRAQRQRFDSKLQRAAFRIVELAGQPIAAVWSSEHDDHVFLHELLVLPEFQNRGLGSEILRRELARAEAVRKPMRLHTLVLNRAQEFYKRHGFIETGRGDVYVDMERAG